MNGVLSSSIHDTMAQLERHSVSEKKRACGQLTMRQQPNILNPYHRHPDVPVYASVSDLSLLHRRSIPAKEPLLYVPKRRTSFQEVNSLDARCESLEISNSL